MLKCKKVWIAEHPNEQGNREISFDDKSGERVYIDTGFHSGESVYVEYVEHILIPIES